MSAEATPFGPDAARSLGRRRSVDKPANDVETSEAGRPSEQQGARGAFRALLRAGAEAVTAPGMGRRHRPVDPLAALFAEHRIVHPKADVEVLRRAYRIAEQVHRGQLRKSGEPYITHP